jgi:integrase
MPSLVKPKSKRKGQPTRVSRVYHIRYYCPFRRRSVAISTRCRHRKNAEKCLRAFCDLLERGQLTRDNPFLLQRRQRIEEADRLAIAECLTAFESDLRAGRVRRGKRKAVSRAHADLTMGRVRKIVEGCGLKRANDLATDAVNRLLDRLQETGDIRTQQTRKHHERAIKSFSRWLAATERLDRDPLARLEVTCVEAADVVHGRTAFTTEEIQGIVAAARGGPIYRGLTGEQRALLYVLSATTGLRAKECACVRKGDFGPELTYVSISGRYTKNDQPARQPIPSFFRSALAEYIAPLGDDDFLFPGGWEQDDQGRWVEAGWIAGKEAGEFLRKDAAKVGIVIGRKGKEANGGRLLDFHSLRHSYVSGLARAGISEGLAQKLARASCRAILERYTHREFEELSAAIEGLPVINLDRAVPHDSSAQADRSEGSQASNG